jgi:hypothetical protein
MGVGSLDGMGAGFGDGSSNGFGDGCKDGFKDGLKDGFKDSVLVGVGDGSIGDDGNNAFFSDVVVGADFRECAVNFTTTITAMTARITMNDIIAIQRLCLFTYVLVGPFDAFTSIPFCFLCLSGAPTSNASGLYWSFEEVIIAFSISPAPVSDRNSLIKSGIFKFIWIILAICGSRHSIFNITCFRSRSKLFDYIWNFRGTIQVS